MSLFVPLELSPRDAAAYLAVSRRTLSDLIRKGKVASRKSGTRTLVDMASLQAYYEALPIKSDATSTAMAPFPLNKSVMPYNASIDARNTV